MAPAKKKEVGRKRKAVELDEDDGALHSFVRSTPGAVWVWGEGDGGQLGTGPELESKYRPFPIMTDVPCVQVAAGGMHSVALAKSGAVYTCGVNDDGALGRETDDDGSTEAQIVEGAIKGLKMVAVTAGDSHSLCMTAEGAVYGWGTFRDDNGVFAFTLDSKHENLPVLLLEANEADRAVKICSGSHSAVVLTRSGKVITWGYGGQGQLGRVGKRISQRSRKVTYLTPTPVRLPRDAGKAVDVFTAEMGFFVLTDKDKVYVCGLNNWGQLGLEPDEDEPCVYAPTLCPDLSGKKLKCIKSGQHHSIALSADGTVYCFGATTYGRLGIDLTEDQQEWAPVSKVTENFEGKVTDIACGVAATAAICNGRVYTWGSGVCKLHGMGDNEDDYEKPHMMKETKRFNGQIVTDMSMGGQHVMIVAKSS